MRLILAIALVIAATTAEARDPQQVRAFRHEHPCPVTGKTTGACPGWVVDHIIPLSVYGADRPDNMQWQTVAAAKVKDRLEYEAYQKRLHTERTLCHQP